MFDRMFGEREAAGEFNWYGFGSTAFLRRRLEESGAMGSEGGFLMVLDGGEAVGYTSWARAYYGAGIGSWSWHIGIFLLPDHRGHGVGTAAIRAIAAYLFDVTAAHRLEARIDPDNHAARGMCERAGWTREGTLRQAEFRLGRWRDSGLYSLLRGD